MEMPQKAGFGRIDNESETSFCSYAPVRCPIHPFLPVGTSAMFKGPLKRLLKITAVDILLPPSVFGLTARPDASFAYVLAYTEILHSYIKLPTESIARN